MISAPVFCPQFVARQAELAFLLERRRDLARMRGGIILVGGDAGIGKSRLIREFLDGSGKSRGRVAVGRCRPFGNTPYGPLVELLATLAPGAARLIPAESQDAQLNALADALTAAAEKHAIVGIIEDVHWSDAGTLAVLALLADRLPTTRMLLIATYRANELGPGHPHFVAFGALQRSRSVTLLELEPLSAADARDFIDFTLGAVPGGVSPEIRRNVAAVAEGNPFFTEELLRSVVDRQRFAGSGGTLPTTVHAAILERLAPLSEADRAILTQAAVIGRRFDANLLAHTLDTDLATILPALGRARAAQIVEQTADPSLFRFRHALTREAIYDGLLAAQRQPLHRRIAIALEAHDRFAASADALGYHWWAAGDERKALEHGERCGDEAQALHSYTDAVESYERTLTLLDPAGIDAARVHTKIGICYFREGAMGRAIDAFRHAWGIVGSRTDDAPQLYSLARFLTAALYNDGRTREAVALLHDAVAAIERCGDVQVSLQARLRYSNYLVEFGDIAEAATALAAIDPDTIADDRGRTMTYWQTRCRLGALQGDVAGMREAFERVAELGDDPAHAAPFIEAIGEAGITATLVGEMALARRALASAIDTCIALRLPASHGDLLVESSIERGLSGDYAAARERIVRALAMIGEGRLGRFRAVFAALSAGIALADRSLLAHAPDAASPFLSQAFATGLPLVYGPLCAVCVDVLAARGDDDAAHRLLRLALRTTLGAQTAFGSFPLVVVAAQCCERADAANVRRLAAATAGYGPAAAATAELAEALLTRRFGDPVHAASPASRAAAAFAAIGWPLYEAFARECAGDAAAAAAIVARIGYRAKNAARAHDAAAAAPRLTPRELDVARLVAGGRTNREIAAALFVSVKLVEKLLSSIYAKLGLNSRSQLTAHMIAGGVDRAARP